MCKGLYQNALQVYGAAVVVLRTKQCLRCQHHIWMKIGVLATPLLIAFLLMHLGKQGEMTHVFRPLDPPERPGSSFWLSAAVWPTADICKVHCRMKALSLSLSTSLASSL